MSTEDKACRTCGNTEDLSPLELCGVCSKFFCPDCAHRAFGGRRFCSPDCAHAYFFHGEPDDEDNDVPVEE